MVFGCIDGWTIKDIRPFGGGLRKWSVFMQIYLVKVKEKECRKKWKFDSGIFVIFLWLAAYSCLYHGIQSLYDELYSSGEVRKCPSKSATQQTSSVCAILRHFRYVAQGLSAKLYLFWQAECTNKIDNIHDIYQLVVGLSHARSYTCLRIFNYYTDLAKICKL